MENKEIKFIHEKNIQLRFNDFDMLGHVNNAVYQHYFDLARMNYFKEVIGEELDWADFSIIMASINIEYKNSIKMNEPISIRSRISVIGEKSITMIQEVYNSKSKELKAMNTATMVGFSAKSRQSSKIPGSWKENIFNYEDQVKFKYPK